MADIERMRAASMENVGGFPLPPAAPAPAPVSSEGAGGQ